MASFSCHDLAGTKRNRLERIVRWLDQSISTDGTKKALYTGPEGVLV